MNIKRINISEWTSLIGATMLTGLSKSNIRYKAKTGKIRTTKIEELTLYLLKDVNEFAED